MKNVGLFLVLLSFSLVSCSTDDATGTGETLVKLKYEDFVDEKMNQVLTEELKMSIYPGDTPPFIEGGYLVNPFYCRKSNFSDGYEGMNFGSTAVFFLNQNKFVGSIDFNSLLTYNPGFVGKSERWDGKGCFISGGDNKFSVVFHTEGTLDVGSGISALYKNLVAVSGELDIDSQGVVKGIKDYQMASVMLDDFDDPYGVLIAIGKGRLWTDEYAERQ
ncbi:hypothetical protein [Flavobacterium sp. JP2137]|uniref:hypothetical protein n=1 Tax=Flavobacterium sp. JP2137 TaxID=3414510 RepID=UPI003D2FE796